MTDQNETIQPAESLQKLGELVQNENAKVQLLRREMHKVIVGQEMMLDRLLIALLCNGHVLLEGVPGLAKTLAVKTLASAISVDFNRIQFTPDLLPADITGTQIYDQKSGDFSVRKADPFSPILFWRDEINRAPAKVQPAPFRGDARASNHNWRRRI